MRFTASERQSLIGPLVVGLLFGALAGLTTASFALEYGRYVHQESSLPVLAWVALEAGSAFALVAGSTFFLLGVLPLSIGRLSSRAAKNRDA
jgi:hypothetical protein